jgi:hypothetical protein
MNVPSSHTVQRDLYHHFSFLCTGILLELDNRVFWPYHLNDSDSVNLRRGV